MSTPGNGAAVFLDRDGVLNAALVREGKPYAPATLQEFTVLPGVREACARLKAAGFHLVVVTNQPEVGRGAQSQEAVEAMHAKLRRLVPELDRIEVCYDAGRTNPRSPDRKPAPGMVLRAARELGVQLFRSFLVGDRWRDIDCGHAAGCHTIFIDRGYAESLRHQPDFYACDLAEAAKIILENSPTRSTLTRASQLPST
jgi:D-glycero-D-manno-heptose 1,7-bisphosphate phosphatase